MIRYLLWQLRHMHTLHFDIINHQPVCPRCGEVYKRKEKNMSTQTPTVPKQKISLLTALAFAALFAGLVIIVVASIFSMPYLLALGGFDGLVAITFAVLSLRESI